MIFPRGARLITPAENQRFSPGAPDFCPTRKIRDFPPGTPTFAPREKSEIFPAGTPYATAEKYCRRGTFSGRCARSRARVIFNEIIPLPRRKSRCGGNYSPTPLCEGVTPSRSRVAIRACSSPCAVPRRAARLSRGRSLSRRENAVTPCSGGIIPPHPHTIALSLFLAFILPRNCAEKFRGHSLQNFSRP